MALLKYEGPAQPLVARIKYGNARATIDWLALAMAPLVGEEGPAVLTWAPTSVARRQERGFDQAELLTRAIGRRLGWSCVAVLERLSAEHQTGRSRADRWSSAPVFRVRRGREMVGMETVVVVDDIITSGATLAGAARALREAGASRVVGLAAARTPRVRTGPR